MLLKGLVVPGDQIARWQGYPTANIDLSETKDVPADGVYAAYVYVAGQKYPAAFVIQSAKKKWEAHLIDLSEANLYGQEIEVEIVKKIGEIETLPVAELVVKIAEDVEKVRKVLKV